jgi:nucleotide-binding universal stress UspA family protein
MWMPKVVRERRKRLAGLREASEARVQRTDKAVELAEVQVRKSDPIARRSAELSKANNIAAILAGSLHINGEHGKHHPYTGH